MPPTPASPPARRHPIPRAAASPLGRLDRRAALAAASVAACVAALALVPAPASAAASAEAVLKRADRTLGTPRALRFEATGTGATFGQAFEPGGPWPKLNLSQFVRTMDYANGAMREDSARSRAEPTGGGAVPLMGAGEQRIQGYVAGRHAWNMVGPAPVAVPVALETRLHDLWTSPHGVIAAARRNAATVDFVTVGGRSLAAVSFTEPGVMKATAYLDREGVVERVEAVMPHPGTGDTKGVTEYMDYRPQGAVSFPSRIRQSHFGQTTLDLAVGKVEVDPATGYAVPDLVRGFAERVASTAVVPGVWFLAGGSHNSVLVEMKDHLVLVEAPLYDGRSSAVIAEARRLVPGKPIRTAINSHHHFDHSGGLRTAAAEGITLMVAKPAQPFFAKTLANPNRVRPDALAKSGKAAKFATYSGTTTLTDGARRIDIHAIDGSIHARGFTMVHLPAEKLLIEADAYTPGAPGSAPPAKPNDNHVNLAQNIDRLKLAVDRILPLHGPVVPLAELHRMIGRAN